eukprot:1275518-Pleurochrysis_carterae.AAC.3
MRAPQGGGRILRGTHCLLEEGCPAAGVEGGGRGVPSTNGAWRARSWMAATRALLPGRQGTARAQATRRCPHGCAHVVVSLQLGGCVL